MVHFCCEVDELDLARLATDRHDEDITELVFSTGAIPVLLLTETNSFKTTPAPQAGRLG